MESPTVDAEWMKFFCKSGELLFYYNKVTAEHRWPGSSLSGNGNSCSIDGGSPISVGTQTEDYGCSNGCTSVNVDGVLIQSHQVDKQDCTLTANSPLKISKDASEGSGNTEFDSNNEFKTEMDVPTNCGLADANESKVTDAWQPTVELFRDVMYRERSGNIVFHSDSEIQLNKEVPTNQSPEGITESNVPEASQPTVTSSESVSQYNQQSVKDQQFHGNQSKRFKCKTCAKAFSYKSGLCRHELLHLGLDPSHVKLFECKTCGRTFRQKATLESHENIHTGKKPYRCQTCDRGFANRAGLYYHKQSHMINLLNYKCKTCDKGFQQKASLRLHEKLHTRKKPFKCETCDTTFAQKKTQRYHELTHTGVKLHECKICNKTFRQKVTLDIHQNVHTGAKPYKCKTCNKGFGNPSSLSCHKTLVHKNAELHECNTCGKTFSQKGNLKKHERIHIALQLHNFETSQ